MMMKNVIRLIHFKLNRVEAKQSLFEIENILPVYDAVRDTAYKYVLRMRVSVIITKLLTLGHLPSQFKLATPTLGSDQLVLVVRLCRTRHFTRAAGQSLYSPGVAL